VTRGGSEASKPPVPLRRKAARIDRLLEARYGPPCRRRPRDPLPTLIGTILSQHTSDTNSHRALARLCARFSSWEAVRDAPVGAVFAAVRSAGLGAIKARRIQAALRGITAHVKSAGGPEHSGARRGTLSLEFLRRWPTGRAKAWLQSLDGIGPKTAAIVLLFGLGKPAFPVDTHVHRVGRRLGLIPPGLSAEGAHEWMEGIVRPERYAPFHLLLIHHGREVCRARRPRCPICPVKRWCEFYRRRI
jgi:endonuclease-3